VKKRLDLKNNATQQISYLATNIKGGSISAI
jgi:hypothetical protein